VKSLATVVIVVLFLMGASQVPAPISEIAQPTPRPKPKQEAAPKVKSKPEATPKAKRNPLKFAGAWSGTMAITASDGSSGSSSYLIEISDDEKTALFRWAAVGNSFSGPPEQAPCTRFGPALSWSLSNPSWTDTFSMRLNIDGTASFLMEGRWTSGDYEGITYSHSGTLSRLGASSGPPGSQTTIASTSQTPAGAAPKNAGGLPVASPVPNKPGFVYDPFEPNSKVLLDVRGKASGTKLKDPFSGKLFITP
jgi:hypothetical protein